jgi:hypothetical protein
MFAAGGKLDLRVATLRQKSKESRLVAIVVARRLDNWLTIEHGEADV